MKTKYFVKTISRRFYSNMVDAFTQAESTLISVAKQKPLLVRPAVDTPKGLYFLSNLGQFHGYPIELVFTYKTIGAQATGNASNAIKNSLAKTLVKFYPFAGCLTKAWDGKYHIRCTGEGVQFVEAYSDNKLDELGDVSVVDAVKHRQFVHSLDVECPERIIDVPLFTVQVTKFRCGGIVLGMTLNHVFIDGIALAYFLNSWAEVTRGVPLLHKPFLDHSILSARHPPLVNLPHPEFVKPENPSQNIFDAQQEPRVFRSFCFEPKNIQKLKELAKQNACITNPTTFEVISALMWVLRTKALKIESEKTSKLSIVVNGRQKLNPPIPDSFIGNGIVWSVAECTAGELVEKPFSFAVMLVHEAIKRVTEEKVRSAIDCYEVMRCELEAENTCWLTKWGRLPFYDVDFGWGEPAQVAPASVVWNLVILLSQERGSENVVMSLGLPESAMESFQEMMQVELD